MHSYSGIKILFFVVADRHEHHGPTIAVIECPNAQSMKSGIQALDDFPCVSIPSNARDSHYQVLNSELIAALTSFVTLHIIKCITFKPWFMQVLGWQQVAARIGMQRCAASSQWLNERISLSRYAHVMSLFLQWEFCSVDMDVSWNINFSNSLGQVPLGNFELDWLIYTADVIFSRALRDQQQVFCMSWYLVMLFLSFKVFHLLERCGLYWKCKCQLFYVS